MKNNVIEYNDTYRSILSEMIHKLYFEDPEGEPMDNDKLVATIRHSSVYPESLKIYILLNDSNKPIGYAIVQLIWSNEFGGITANIDEMYIVKCERGNGFATKFINEVTQLIPEVKRVTLEVTPSNDNALKLYKMQGFKESGNRHMEKIIKEVR